jgi:alpha-ketoglutarate-dependent taurine dioxygenase
MTLQVEKLDATFGARVTGVELASINEVDFDQLYDLWLDRALLVFPEQHLTKDQQKAFANRFGELEFELSPIGNVRKDGSLRANDASDRVVQILKGNEGWHYDSTYVEVQALATVFTAHQVPSKDGQTGWADMRAGYAALDDDLKTKIKGLSAHHSLYHSQRKIGHDPKVGSGYGFNDQAPPLRPLVKIHPETGIPALLIGRHAYDIPGLTEKESETLLQGLTDFACQAPRVYVHDWTVGDAILWDNRCLMHRAYPWDFSEAREMWLARIAGNPLTESGSTGSS